MSSSPELFVAAIAERHDNQMLIALPATATDAERYWQFPRGLAHSDESPEKALRRVVLADLGIRVQIVVGQPPLSAPVDGKQAELRYFFCGIVDGTPQPGPYAEIRWVPKHHLEEYEFDEASRPVVDWLLH